MTSFEAPWALFAIFAVQAVTDLAVVGLGRNEPALLRALPYLVSGAGGVLLATACLDLLPEAVRDGGPGPGVWIALLVSLLVLFCLQAWAHSVTPDLHAPHDAAGSATKNDTSHGNHLTPVRRTSAAPLLFGSSLHSFVDGVAIAAAFAAGSKPGWSAAIAVGLHEMPHRLSDFSLLLHSGLPRRRAAQLAIGAGAMAFPGGVAVAALGRDAALARWLLPVSAGSFLYIALADLVPELHAQRRRGRLLSEVTCLVGGALLMAIGLYF